MINKLSFSRVLVGRVRAFLKVQTPIVIYDSSDCFQTCKKLLATTYLSWNVAGMAEYELRIRNKH